MAHDHVETNPHFIDPDEVTPEQRHYLPAALLPRRGHDHRIPPRDRPDSRHGRDQRIPPPLGDPQRHQRPDQQQQQHSQDERPRPHGPSPPEPHREGQPHVPLHVWVPPVQHAEPHYPLHPRPGQQRQPLEMWVPPQAPAQGPTPKKQRRQGRQRKEEAALQPQLQDQHPKAPLVKEPQGETPEHPSPGPGVIRPQRRDQRPDEHRPHSRILPQDRRTKAPTWFAAAFCIIFWLVIIIGGLIVLIIYLVFRPHLPRFDVNSVTLNAAYLDMGYLLNADITVLANFSNPNRKVRVDFSSMHLDLYFESTMIATQYIQPFSAARGQTIFANIHMVTSQVRLSMKDTMLLKKQIDNNRVMLTFKGAFRARSNLGGFLKYSYWLHGNCGIILSSPPAGVLRAKKCTTKH